MDEPHNEPKRSSGNVWLWVVLLPVIYVLSIGPVAKFLTVIGASPGTHDVAKTFYAPLFWLHKNTFLKEPLEKYMELWGL